MLLPYMLTCFALLVR